MDADPVAAPAQLTNLTLLRFVRATWVVLYHYLPPQAGAGWIAVLQVASLRPTFFFVLSGFVLAYAYTPARLKAEGRRAFYLRRVARLVPSYLVALGVIAFVIVAWWLRASVYDKPIPTAVGDLAWLPLHALLLQAWLPEHALEFNRPMWALSVEFLFYALFPFLVRLRPATRLGLTIGAFAYTVGMLYARVEYDLVSAAFAGFHPSMHVAYFLLGMVLVDVRSGWDRIPALPLFVLAVATTAGTLWIGLAAGEAAASLAGFTLWPWSGALWIMAVLRVRSIAATSIWVRLGDASYSMFVWHIPWLLVAGVLLSGVGIEMTTPMLFVLAAAVVPLSVWFWRNLERPAEKALRARWGLSRAPKDATPPGPAPDAAQA